MITLMSTIKIIAFIIFIPLFEIYGVILSIILVSLATATINLIWFYRLPKTFPDSTAGVLHYRDSAIFFGMRRALQNAPAQNPILFPKRFFVFHKLPPLIYNKYFDLP